LQVSVEVIFSSQTQKGANFSDLLAILYRPWGQFWFLYALLWMHITHTLFSYLGKYGKPLMFLAAVTLFFYPLHIGILALGGFSVQWIFFTGGVLFKNQMMQSEKSEIPLWGVIILLGALVGSGYFIFTKLIDPIRLSGSPHRFYFLFLSVLGIIACSALAQYLARQNILRFLQTLGTYSLQIYLVHMLAGVGMRMILQMAGIQHWATHIIIGTVFAMIAPILLQKISDRFNFPYLFELKT
jgi:peptidoglycan/LPS O-acetylase OafA/YrhL